MVKTIVLSVVGGRGSGNGSSPCRKDWESRRFPKTASGPSAKRALMGMYPCGYGVSLAREPLKSRPLALRTLAQTRTRSIRLDTR